MENQKIEHIALRDLVLWTENPRDLIDVKAKDQDIVDIALEDTRSKWTLPKLAKEMGDHYDFSELPTVVYQDNRPVVYDGNRRVILGKIKHNLVSIEDIRFFNTIPNIPDKIPCNVCTKKIALENIQRKHINGGSWDALQRDIFLHNFMGEKKSNLMIIDEETNLITTTPYLNQRYVKDEIFNDSNLEKLGFIIQAGRLKSIHTEAEAMLVLNSLADKIKNKELSTRNSRGNAYEILDDTIKDIIKQNKCKPFNLLNSENLKENLIKKEHQPKEQATKRTPKKELPIFGKPLTLKSGVTNDLYRDICDLYTYYCKHKKKLSKKFANLISMSLRLLCECATDECKYTKIDNYIKEYFDEAKGNLSKDYKTLLSNQSITSKKMIEILHTSAHKYTSSSNITQIIAMSIILGEMLILSHSKKVKG